MSRPCLRLLLLARRPLHPTWPRPYSTRSAPSSVNGYVPPTQTPCHRHHSTHTTPNHDGSTTNTSSVNASEVSHFTTLASSWWDPHGPSRLLHLMNPLRHDFIKSCLASNPSSTSPSQPTYTYLDIGCGGGIFASSAARLPTTRSVTAIDPTPSVIAVARAHQRTDPTLRSRLTYLNTPLEDLRAHTTPPPAGYDFISLFEVIEHIDRPAAFLRDALKHLRVGGWLVGSTIARHPLSYLTTKVVAEAPWPVGVVPRGTHDWEKYINPGELGAWFELENRLARERDQDGGDVYGKVRIEGCVYIPVMGWRFVKGSEEMGNYFFGVQKLRESGGSGEEEVAGQ